MAIDARNPPTPLVRPTIIRAGLTYAGWLWLALLAGQFVLVQLFTGLQYGDAPRNLHWGALLVAQPGFLVGGRDDDALIKGFVPQPPSLAPNGAASNVGTPYNVRWGPVPVLLLAAMWWATRSRMATALVVPLIGGALVLATYAHGRRLYGRGAGLAAATLLALIPVLREHTIVSYSESISAICLLAALWCYSEGRTTLTVVTGTLAVLCKVDMPVVYGGAVGAALLWRLWCVRNGAPVSLLRHPLVALLPLAALPCWFFVSTGSALPPAGADGGFSARIFGILALSTLQRFALLPWYTMLVLLAVVCAFVWLGLMVAGPTGEQRVVLGAWLGCGLLVLLRFLGAFNALDNPRVLIPSLPALAVLAGGGWASVQARWRWSFGGVVVALLLLGNANLSAAQREYYVYHRSLQPVWEQLRAQPRGFVLAPDEYWNTLWYGGQPVTAFEGDPTFQRNILYNADNFRRYTRANQIRYAIVPKPETPARVAGPLNGIDIAGMYGPDVLRYLNESATSIDAGGYWIYVLQP